jgi:hypothetical protein
LGRIGERREGRVGRALETVDLRWEREVLSELSWDWRWRRDFREDLEAESWV